MASASVVLDRVVAGRAVWAPTHRAGTTMWPARTGSAAFVPPTHVPHLILAYVFSEVGGLVFWAPNGALRCPQLVGW